MVFHYPWGLLGLLALPTIVALHYLRSRRREVRIGGLHLWQFARTRPPVGGRWERIIPIASLFTQLLAALLFTLLIAGLDLPRESGVRHYAIILDNSISMNATSEGESSAARARKLLADWAPSLGRFTLIAAGEQPQVLAGPYGEREEFQKALEAWQPEAAACDLKAAGELALKLMNTEQPVLVVSDRAEPDGRDEAYMRIYALGRPLPNCGFEFADRMRLSPQLDRIMVRLRSYSSEPQSTTLRAWIDETQIFEDTIALAAGEIKQLSFETESLARPLRLELGDDALDADNHAWLAPLSILEVRVSEEGLDAMAPYLARAVRAVPYARYVSDAGEAHLVFSGFPAPSALPELVNFVRLPHPGIDVLLGIAQGHQLTVNRQHELSRNLGLEGVIWPYAQWPEKPAATLGEPLVEFTTQSLLAQVEPLASAQAWELNLLCDRSNIFQQPAWPALIERFIEMTRERLPGLTRSNLRQGEDVNISALAPLAAEGEACRVMRGEEEILREDVLPPILGGLPAGFYQVLSGEAAVAAFAVNLFAPEESDLNLCERLGFDLNSLETSEAQLLQTNRTLFYLLLLGAIAAMAAAWALQDRAR